jgi:hypothetical protein
VVFLQVRKVHKRRLGLGGLPEVQGEVAAQHFPENARDAKTLP